PVELRRWVHRAAMRRAGARVIQPAVRVGCRHGETRHDDQNVAWRQASHALKPLTATAAMRRHELRSEECDVRSERRRDVTQCGIVERLGGQRIERAQYGTGIRAPASEPAANGDLLADLDREAAQPWRALRVGDAGAK